MGQKFNRTRNLRRLDDFPAEVRAMADEMLKDPRNSYKMIADSLTEQGYEISKSSICRYAKDTQVAAMRLAAAAEQSRALIEAVRDNRDLEATEVATALMINGLTNKIATAEEEFDELPLAKAGQLLVQLQRTSVYKDRYKRDRKRIIENMRDTLMAELREAVQGDDALAERLACLTREVAKREAAKEDG